MTSGNADGDAEKPRWDGKPDSRQFSGIPYFYGVRSPRYRFDVPDGSTGRVGRDDEGGRVHMKHPERRLLISADMERYSLRGNVRQYEAQRSFQEILHEAATAVGLDRVSWKIQQAGDGELAILPGDIPESRVIGRFVPELNRRLREYNSSRMESARVRLRVALHQGLVHLDGENGYPGNAVNEVCRLCDAKPLKEALAAFPQAGVALIVSETIYREVVREYPEELRPERFRRIEVHHPDKEFRQWAWICVVDEDLSAFRRGDGEDRSSGDGEGGSRGEEPTTPRPRSGGPAGEIAEGGIRTGDIWVSGGQNAVGHGATAVGPIGSIGSIGGDLSFGGGGRA